MDRIIYTSMTGASATMQRQAVLANNLANVSTNGFRAEMFNFRAVPVQGDGSSTRVYALETTTGQSQTPGPVQRTGRNLDAMAVGNAWFAVQGADGSEAYTRNGAFTVNSEGQLVTQNGLTVLSDGGSPIDAPQGADLTLGSDGTVTALVPGQQQPQTIARLKLVTPDADDPIKRGDDGLFHTASGDPLPSDPNAQLLAGALEGSNVNAVECMVGMIAAARQFEQQMQLLQTARDDDKSAGQLLSVSA